MFYSQFGYVRPLYLVYFIHFTFNSMTLHLIRNMKNFAFVTHHCLDLKACIVHIWNKTTFHLI